MIFGGGFIGFLAVIVVIRLLAQIRDQCAPVTTYAGAGPRAEAPVWLRAIGLAAAFAGVFAAMLLLRIY